MDCFVCGRSLNLVFCLKDNLPSFLLQIRETGGLTGLITPMEMAFAISNIQTYTFHMYS